MPDQLLGLWGSGGELPPRGGRAERGGPLTSRPLCPRRGPRFCFRRKSTQLSSGTWSRGFPQGPAWGWKPRERQPGDALCPAAGRPLASAGPKRLENERRSFCFCFPVPQKLRFSRLLPGRSRPGASAARRREVLEEVLEARGRVEPPKPARSVLSLASLRLALPPSCGSSCLSRRNASGAACTAQCCY